MNKKVVVCIKKALLDLAFENNKRMLVGIGDYANYRQAMSKTTIMTKLRTGSRVDFRNIVCVGQNYKEEFDEAEAQLKGEGLLECHRYTRSKIVYKLTVQGMQKQIDWTSKTIEQILQIDMYSYNAGKTYRKVLKIKKSLGS